MKLSIRLQVQMIALLLLSTPVWADTVVTTSSDTVTVHQQPNQNQTVTQVVVQPAGTQTVVLQKQAVIVLAQRDPRELQGRIVKVDLAAKKLTVHDINGRDRRVLVWKTGMINHYRVDDYVQIYLTPDLTEAMKIRTKQGPDFEGDVVAVDMTNYVIVVRDENGSDRNAAVRPDMIREYQVGDRVGFYAVSENSNLQEAQIIRIK